MILTHHNIGSVCRVSALGGKEIADGEHASRLINSDSECEVFTCEVIHWLK